MTKKAFLLFSLCFAGSLLVAQDWPVFRNNHYRDGITGGQPDIGTLGLEWSFEEASLPRQAWGGAAKWDSYARIINLRNMRNYDPVYHPVVSLGRIYFSSTGDDTLYCLDARSGKLVWKRELNAASRIAPSVYGDRIYLGCDDGRVYCFQSDSGELLWSYEAVDDSGKILNDGRVISSFPVRTGVLVHEGRAYFGISLLPWERSYLCSLDAISGELIYQKEFEGEEYTMEGAMAVVDNRLVIPQGRIAPLLFDLKSGKMLGSLPGGNGCYTFVTEDKTIMTGPVRSGKAFNELESRTRGASVSTYEDGNAVLVHDGAAYLLSDHSLKAIERKSGQTRWELRGEYPYDLIMAGSLLFVGGEDRVAAVDSSTGRRLWEAEVSGKVYGLAYALQRLYVSTDEGKIYCFAAGGRDAARYRMSGKTAASKGEVKTDILFSGDRIVENRINSPVGAVQARFEGELELLGSGEAQAVLFGADSTNLLIATDMQSLGLPDDHFTVSAVVRIDSPAEKGGIYGVADDAAGEESGWMLGYSGNFFNFRFRCDTSEGLTALTAAQPFEKGRWYRLTATYDNREAKLFVDGKLSRSIPTGGKLLYPRSGYYTAGVWRDRDEFLPMKGALHRVTFSSGVSSPEQISKNLDPRFMASLAYARLNRPQPAQAGPFWKFTGRESAEVFWETAEPSPSRLYYGRNIISQTAGDGILRKHHRVQVNGIGRDRRIRYSVAVKNAAGLESRSPVQTADSFFNYTLEGMADTAAIDPVSLERIRSICELSPRRGGVSVILGSRNPDLAAALASLSGGRVILLETDPLSAAAARRRLRSLDYYGDRVTLLLLSTEELRRLPAQFASFVLLNMEPQELADAELSGREAAAVLTALLKPDGGLLALLSSEEMLKEGFDAASIRYGEKDGMLLVKQQSLPGAGSWGHIYGNPGQATFTGETLQGARSTDDMKVQWIGKPGARYQTDRNGRKVPPVAENGRLYLQGYQRIICLEQYSGAILWSLESPDINRMNMPRDGGNWFADDDRLYLAVRDRLCRFNGATGELIDSFPMERSKGSRNQEWSYLSGPAGKVVGSSTLSGASYTNFWGNGKEGWYDATSGSVTDRVLSDNLFVLDRESGSLIWKRESPGLIVNPTITIEGNHVIFLESQNGSLKSGSQRRLNWAEMSENAKLVCLNLEDGALLWEKGFSTSNAETMMNGAMAEGRYVLSVSGRGRYRIYCYDALSGRQLWSKKLSWAKGRGDHGVHMSKPVIVNGRVYVRPGYYDLNKGKRLGKDQPVQKGGCSTYTATTEMIIFRSSDLCLWDPLAEKKISRWKRLRPDCWLSTIPADGMILSPEGGGGCSCGNWLEASIGFIPLKSEIGKGQEF